METWKFPPLLLKPNHPPALAIMVWDYGGSSCAAGPVASSKLLALQSASYQE